MIKISIKKVFWRAFFLLMLVSLLFFLAGCSQAVVTSPTVANEVYKDESVEEEEVNSSVGAKAYEVGKEQYISDEEILEAMVEKYKLYKRAWRIGEREPNEEPLQHYLKYARGAVGEELLQKGVEFFNGPPQGYASSAKESLLEAKIKSRTSDRAVISSMWEEEIMGDGFHSKDVNEITVKMKKENDNWLITGLEIELISQEELEQEY